MEDLSGALSSSHDVKISLCYLLDKINRPVTEQQLYEIVLDSEVINYFYYTEAITELINNGSVSKNETDGTAYIVIEKKGRLGADYFNEYIPYYFRKRILRSAVSFFAKLDRENQADVDIVQTANGCEVNCTIKDTGFDLMRISLYSPDKEQAELIKDNILLNPIDFYQKIIGYALENKEKEIQIDIEK